jgi:prepilin-type N-terminal cleavage/methylation domain-containing protein
VNLVSRLRSRRGFTVIELLVVVGIIAFLLALIGIIAARARMKARTSKTKALIKRVQMALDAYKTVHREYPGGWGAATKDTWPDPYDIAGVEFDHRVTSQSDPGGFPFDQADMDPKDKNYLLDAWGQRIRYRKVSPGHMLVWSTGPDKIDQIGKDVGKARERGSSIPVGSDVSDDLSNVEVDY